MKKLVILAIALVAVLLLIAPVSACATEKQLTDAYNGGYQVGYNEAYTPAYEEGHTVGYVKGLDEGYNEGYNIGSADMRRTLEATIQALREQLSVIQEKDGQSPKTTFADMMFFFYYRPLADQQYGIRNLEKCLSTWEWAEGVYEFDVFDCSEMSAFLEWYLENQGFNTIIVTGNPPDGRDGKHAWVLVETTEGKYMPVEATTWSIVLWENPYFDNYFDYIMEFETIQEAIECSLAGFDWWTFKD